MPRSQKRRNKLPGRSRVIAFAYAHMLAQARLGWFDYSQSFPFRVRNPRELSAAATFSAPLPLSTWIASQAGQTIAWAPRGA